MNRFFRFNFTKETALAFGAGATMIFLSLIMLFIMRAFSQSFCTSFLSA